MYFAGSFPNRNPLSSIKRGGQGISLYMQLWGASKHASGSSAYLFPLALLALVLLMLLAFRCVLQTSLIPSI